MDSFYDISAKDLPEPSNPFALDTIGEKVIYGSMRIVFENRGGYMLLGQCGYDANGRMRYGQLLHDGEQERIFVGVER